MFSFIKIFLFSKKDFILLSNYINDVINITNRLFVQLMQITYLETVPHKVGC
jgi:hypothetical protein